jgi:hypothetical protein
MSPSRSRLLADSSEPHKAHALLSCYALGCFDARQREELHDVEVASGQRQFWTVAIAGVLLPLTDATTHVTISQDYATLNVCAIGVQCVTFVLGWR